MYDEKMKKFTEAQFPERVENAKDFKSKLFSGIGVRYVIASIMFLVMASGYLQRVSLSVTIVAMVNSSSIRTEHGSADSCPLPQEYNTTSRKYRNGEYTWNENTQGLLLGSFYYGYAITNFFSGMLAERYGSRLIVGLGIFLSSLISASIPFAAGISSTAIVILRILQGMGDGCVVPPSTLMIAQWFPSEERSRFSSIIFTGCNAGTILALMSGGFLCGSEIFGGWPSVFYIYGAFGILCCLLWLFVVRDCPETHPWISEKEKKYIKTNIFNNEKTRPPIPWRSILTSKYFYIILIMHIGMNWGYYTLLSELPKYFDEVLHIDIESNGKASSLPYLAIFFVSVTYSIVVGFIQKRDIVSVLFIRKLSMALAGYGPMICLFSLSFANCNTRLALTLLISSGAFIGFTYCGFICSHADIAPRYAGTLMGLTNSIATIPGFVSPALTGFLINENPSIEAWRKVFFIASAFYVVCTTIYIFGITTQVQTWNDGNLKPKTDKCNRQVKSNLREEP